MSDRTCPSCRSSSSARVPRVGVFQTLILPLFGLYPWECINCLRVYFHRSRGKHHRSAVAAVANSTSTSNQA